MKLLETEGRKVLARAGNRKRLVKRYTFSAPMKRGENVLFFVAEQYPTI